MNDTVLPCSRRFADGACLRLQVPNALPRVDPRPHVVTLSATERTRLQRRGLPRAPVVHPTSSPGGITNLDE